MNQNEAYSLPTLILQIIGNFGGLCGAEDESLRAFGYPIKGNTIYTRSDVGKYLELVIRYNAKLSLWTLGVCYIPSIPSPFSFSQ